MNLNQTRLWVLNGLSAIFFAGCNISDLPESLDADDLYLPNYEGTIALILGKDTLTVGDFIEEAVDDTDVIQETENAEIFIVYEDSTEFTADGDFIDVTTFSNSRSVASPIAVPFVAPFDTTLVISRELNFEYIANDGEQIDSIFYSGGALQLSLTSDFPGDVAYSLNTNSFENVGSGEGVDISGLLNYFGFTPLQQQNSTNLAGYRTTLTFENDSSVFKVNLEAVISIQAGTSLTGNESIFVEADVLNPEFDAIYGNFGRDTFDIESQTIDLDIFSEFSESGLSFESPSVIFTFENSFGLPAGLDFSGISASFDDQPNLPLTGSFAETLQIVGAPIISDAGETVETTLTMSKDNSNIGDILSASPDQLNLTLVGYSNPNDEFENFVLGNSRIKVKSKIELPLSLRLDGFEYESDFDLGDISQLDQGESITLILRTSNELPINGELDLHFIDNTSTAIDSIVNVSILESPQQFDNIGKTLAPAAFETRIELDAAKIESLTNSEKLNITVRFNSFGFQQDNFVQIFSDYTLITTVLVEGKVSININE